MNAIKHCDKMRWKHRINDVTRMERLQQRQQILSTIREDLLSHGFLEVETPLLVKSTCPDAHIDSIQVGEGYLITSTEYQIKRLIVGGFEKVFTLTKNFRNNDRGRYHSTEFTMLEWARAHQSLDVIENDLSRFIRKAFCRLYPDTTKLLFNGYEIDLHGPWERLTVRDAFKKYLHLEDLNDFSLKSITSACQKANLPLPASFQHDRELVMSYLLDMLQSHLGKQTPTFLHAWPAYQTSSAPLNAKDPYTSERTELYIGGIEIANGFPFLTDATTQKKLFFDELEKRKRLEKPTVSIDERYLDALEEGLPQGAGMALGIDRLVMVLTGADKLSDVQAFDWAEL